MTEQVKAGGTATINPAPRDAACDRRADAPTAHAADARRPAVILVTGMAGAGRSLALNYFEDLGYEAVDNLPLSMLGALLRGGEAGKPDDVIDADFQEVDEKKKRA